MPIIGVIQPETIKINSTLRLRKYDGIFHFAYSWYQDKETVKLVDGKNALPYDMNKLKRMYTYLNDHGELYFIEILEKNVFTPIGDVTFWQNDMPIVIGDKKYRGYGIGSLVIQTLISRAKFLGYHTIYVNEIYTYNTTSKALFEKNGFKMYKKTCNGYSYKMQL